MDPWVIAIIVIVVFFLIALIVGLIIFFSVRKRNNTPEEDNFDENDENETGPVPEDELPIPPILEPLPPGVPANSITFNGQIYSPVLFSNRLIRYNDLYLDNVNGKLVTTTIFPNTGWTYDGINIRNGNLCLGYSVIGLGAYPIDSTCKKWFFDGFSIYAKDYIINEDRGLAISGYRGLGTGIHAVLFEYYLPDYLGIKSVPDAWTVL